MLKDVFKRVATILLSVTGLVLIAGTIALIIMRSCPNTPRDIIDTYRSRYITPIETYRRPSIRLPFIKPNTPVPYDTLPIPPREIERSITIETEGADGRSVPITIIIDKKGNVYRTKDTPDNVQIKTIEWRRPLIEIRPVLGFSAIWAKDFYNCLTVDLIRVWRIYAGVEIGMQAVLEDFLIGTSLKYEVTDNFTVLAGRDFLGSRYYAGMGFRW